MPIFRLLIYAESTAVLATQADLNLPSEKVAHRESIAVNLANSYQSITLSTITDAYLAFP
ncbi:hypothetical protein D3C85_454090 [compost metagenome]